MRQAKTIVTAFLAVIFLAGLVAGCHEPFAVTAQRKVRREGMVDDRPPLMLTSSDASLAWETVVRRRGPRPIWIGAPQLFLVSGGNQVVSARSRMEPIVVKLMDANGMPIPYVSLRHNSASSPTVLMVSAVNNPNETRARYYGSVTTDSDGLATMEPWVGPAYAPGQQGVSVLWGTTTLNIPFTYSGQVDAASLAFVTGDGQSAEAGRTFGTPFSVQARDAAGDPLPNAQVTFTISPGGGTMLYTASGSGAATSTTSVAMLTGTDGRCNVRVLAPTNPGVTTITATIDGLTATATGTVTGSSTPILSLVSPVTGHRGNTGTTTAPYTVRMTNPDGTPAVGLPVNFVLSGLGSLTATSVLTDASGYASTQLNFPTNTNGSTQTTHNVSASSPAAFGTVAFASSYGYPRPDASWYKYGGDDQSIAVGQAALLPLVVAFRDPYGNPFHHQSTPPPTVQVSVVSGDAVFNGQPGPLNVTADSLQSNRPTVYVTPKVLGPTVIRFTCPSRSYPPIEFTVTGL